MSVKSIHLRKLLQLFYLSERELTTKLREDIRQEIAKLEGRSKPGGDFYVGFWTDAKRHVKGEVDLLKQTDIRIRDNKGRERLYKLLAEGFLKWWDEKRRWRNEPFEIIDVKRVKGDYEFEELGAVVKVESLLCVRVGNDYNRLVYAYFSENPELPEEAARIGLWLMGEAVKDFSRDDNRILDVLRSRSYGLIDSPLQGNERNLFLQKYIHVLERWEKLREEY